MMNYQQCAIHRNKITIITWIPEKYAIKNKFLRIRTGGVWQDYWKVMRVFTVRLHEKDVIENEDVYILDKNIEEYIEENVPVEGPTPPYFEE